MQLEKDVGRLTRGKKWNINSSTSNDLTHFSSRAEEVHLHCPCPPTHISKFVLCSAYPWGIFGWHIKSYRNVCRAFWIGSAGYLVRTPRKSSEGYSPMKIPVSASVNSLLLADIPYRTQTRKLPWCVSNARERGPRVPCPN